MYLGYKQHSPNLDDLSREGLYWKAIHAVAYRIDRRLENLAQRSSQSAEWGQQRLSPGPAQEQSARALQLPSWTRASGPLSPGSAAGSQGESSPSFSLCLTSSLKALCLAGGPPAYLSAFSE